MFGLTPGAHCSWPWMEKACCDGTRPSWTARAGQKGGAPVGKTKRGKGTAKSRGSAPAGVWQTNFTWIESRPFCSKKLCQVSSLATGRTCSLHAHASPDEEADGIRNQMCGHVATQVAPPHIHSGQNTSAEARNQHVCPSPIPDVRIGESH